ncbi:uncharacterized protein K02A2.6-like [Anopheles funestus]|uniref:uncharacterized protein K02A2.6-like n=1 Tax=Anopheles funestus TaxID=62324 RepID=UPI0020C72961|nr:uncharacterized protein K02A2.6-like [Anopheles funestus]
MRSVTINVHNIRDRRKYVNIKLNGSQVRLQLDTGSDISVISRDLWKKIGSPQLTPPSVIAKSASGDKLGILGEFEANVEVSQKKRQAVIYVVESELALLGTDLAEIFSLWSSPIDEFCNNISSATIAPEAILRKFPLLFQPCMGICTKAAITLHLKPDGRPVFSPKRPVAFAMREAVEAELDRLQKLNVITPVEYSEWAAPIVVVRKSNGKLRICGDYSTGLNAALHPHDYPLPLPEDIFAKLGKSTIFSQIDLSDAFLQVPIAEQSRQMLTINTHKGLYLYNRLPPGIKVAPGAFQQLMDQMLAGMEGVSCYMDDIIVGGRTQNEHDELLSETLKRIQEYGFTIRSDKCSFNKNQVRYLGHIIDKHGIQPDPAKVAVIKDLPPPHDIAGVRSFLGAINYYGRFIPNMRSLRYPLDNLLKNDTTFNWSPECQKVFEQFKSLLATDLLLTHYDPGREIIVSADASSVGLGATISHKFPDGSYKVVQHASRALTEAETNYSQIDREGLAIIFAVTKFHKYIFGRHFCLQTDHKPLLRIFGSKKGIPIYTANRLQRFALTLQLYDFDIQYVSTHNFGNADILSRLIKRHDKLNEDYIIASISLEDDIRSVAVNSLTPFVLSFREVENATKTDPVLQKVARYIKEGWPRNSIFNGDLARFYARKDALSIVDNGILFGERVIIPTALRQRCLRQLHHGHPGVQRMKSLARSYVYWPYLDKEITELVANCGACAAAAKSPPHSIPAPWNEATAPWQRVHIDYAGPIDGYSFLIAVDSFSKWPEIIRTASTTSTATVRILRSLFSRYGNPITLVSDNGRQFISAEFEDFCTTNGIDHLTTAPFHPQSNGQAERFVDTFKRAIKKISSDGTTIEDALEIFLGTYRSTPNPQVPEQKAPATIMFGRQIRTCLELIRPVPRSEVKDNIEPHRSFVRDDLVYAKLYARNGWKWIPGRVISKCGNVMYSVMTNDQKIIRSHINQLRRRTADNTNSMEQRLLPMDILLDAWNLPSSSVAASTAQSFSGDPISQPSGSCSNTPNSSTPPATPIPSSSVPMDAAVPSSSQPVEPHSPSSPSNRSGHQQGSCETEQQLPPRHSSRDRRAPRWLDPYLLS